MQLHTGLARTFAKHMSQLLRSGFIDGLPGFVSIEGDDTLQTTALLIEDGQIKYNWMSNGLHGR